MSCMKQNQKVNISVTPIEETDKDSTLKRNRARRKATRFDPNGKMQITVGLVRHEGLYKVIKHQTNQAGHTEQIYESDSMLLPVALAKALYLLRLPN